MWNILCINYCAIDLAYTCILFVRYEKNMFVRC